MYACPFTYSDDITEEEPSEEGEEEKENGNLPLTGRNVPRARIKKGTYSDYVTRAD